jgi:beta-lactamase regulating signal transducer with metallopeptidase domain
MTVIKSAVIFVVVFALNNLFKRLHPRLKYFLWILVFASLIILPIASTLVDSYDVRITRAINNGKTSETISRIASPLSIDLPTQAPSKSLPVFSQDNPVQNPRAVLTWSFAVLCVWVFGILIASSKLCVGAKRLGRIRKTAHLVKGAPYGTLLRELSAEMGIRGEISLLQSDRCRVPFTCGVFRHLVVFPSDLSEWPKERVWAVVRHELVHIKRKDYAIKLFARSVCSLFWFIPFAWVSYAHFCAEQEQACDTAIVESGANPALYARDLIHIARAAREQLLATCIFVSRQKSSLLRKRISNILELKGVKKMKRKIVLYALAFLVALLAVVGNLADAKKINGIYIPEANEEFYGTWVNMKHTGVAMWPQKLVYTHWGYYEGYYKADGTTPNFRGTSTFVDKWADSNGDIWYKTLDREDWTTTKVEYAYYRISKNGSVMEFIWNFEEYPDIEDLEAKYLSAHYRIFYRQ